MRIAITPLFVVATIVLIAGCTSPNTNTNTDTTIQPSNPQIYTVEMTPAGFSPGSLVIKAGDTVNFVNKDTIPHQPASAAHPTHAVYPEPGGCVGSKFDACSGVAPGQSWSFVF